ncbi:hypothetical protein L0F63_002278 [Massospora cicadina]|nr:hypothetical protein L0F63_002278 [Massospora cicadina]
MQVIKKGVEGKLVRAYGYQPEGCGFDSRPSHIDRGASQRKLLAVSRSDNTKTLLMT